MESTVDNGRVHGAKEFANGEINSFIANVEDLTDALRNVETPDIARVKAKVKIALAAAKSALSDSAAQVRIPGEYCEQEHRRLRPRQPVAGGRHSSSDRHRSRDSRQPAIGLSRPSGRLERRAALAGWSGLNPAPPGGTARLVLQRDAGRQQKTSRIRSDSAKFFIARAARRASISVVDLRIG